MDEKNKLVNGPRIRGRAYQVDEGWWTYFILLGDDGEEQRTIHCPRDINFTDKVGAIAAMKSHILDSLKGDPFGIQLTDNKTGKPFEATP